MTSYEYTVLETKTHRELTTHANELGAEGWQMVTVDHAHEFWVGFFQRERAGDASVPVHERIGAGVLELAGGLNDPEG